MELPIDTIVHGRCLDVLKSLPDESVDSINTDPPYGLGTKEPSVEEIIAYLQGSSLDMGGEFMNKDWEIPSVLVWKECFRVLKPGGFLFVFAGTRTQDIMSIGIRAAGFENRDIIDAEQGPPIIRWLRAQGMPKSTDISKQIDKKAGAEREVVGTKKGVGGENLNDLVRGSKKVRKTTEPGGKGVGAYGTGAKQVSVDIPVTVAATDEAKEWEGWGTALKPYWEPILMFRKPVAENTVAEQVLKTGTGGLNIDGARIKHSSPEDFEKHKAGVDAIKARGGSMGNSWKNSSDLSGANDVTTAGRWPPNVLFVHSDGCQKVGTKTVKAPTINRFDDGAKPFGGGAGHEYTSTQTGDENGEEEVGVWDCHPSCPIGQLNAQSGVTVSRPDLRSGGALDTREMGWRFKRNPSALNDSGGASRFFANFDPFVYVPKPSQSEKNDGLEFGDENEHPTVKPVKLMRYLVKLNTRKGGIVLDPYCGSGTTCVAAVAEGMHFIGIEKDEASVRTAQGRVLKILQETREWETQREIHRLATTIPEDDEPIVPV